MPRGGFWQEILNSDAPLYGGSGQGNIGGVQTTPVGWHGHYQSVNVVLPPLGMVALKWDGAASVSDLGEIHPGQPSSSRSHRGSLRGDGEGGGPCDRGVSSAEPQPLMTRASSPGV